MNSRDYSRVGTSSGDHVQMCTNSRIVKWTAPCLWRGALLTAFVTLAGCVRIQTAIPVLAPLVVGPMACPNCGLLLEQGCPCRPDDWAYGYHPTRWRQLSVESSEDAGEAEHDQETLPPPASVLEHEPAATPKVESQPKLTPARFIPDDEPPAPNF